MLCIVVFIIIIVVYSNVIWKINKKHDANVIETAVAYIEEGYKISKSNNLDISVVKLHMGNAIGKGFKVVIYLNGDEHFELCEKNSEWQISFLNEKCLQKICNLSYEGDWALFKQNVEEKIKNRCVDK